MSPGAGVLVVAVAAALLLGAVWKSRQGRVRERNGGENVTDLLPDELRQRLVDAPDQDARVTLLQLSTTFCAPCRHPRVLLSDFAQRTEGVRHVDVDLTHHPEWSTPLRVHTTPTTLVLDATGAELFRVSGVPHRAKLATALQLHLS
ncbi:thioredoxin family protein [Saccharopolyspora sp. NPDC000359]|uniref:TlpA family protein disulfide reductase n=1 Tax=Saccharopolyspora sp. NPDC000359 TaxID=3154251 RepID=UPI00332AB30F